MDVQKSGMDPIFKMKSRIQEGEIKFSITPMKRVLKSESTLRNFSQKETYFDIKNHQENVYCYSMKHIFVYTYTKYKNLILNWPSR